MAFDALLRLGRYSLKQASFVLHLVSALMASVASMVVVEVVKCLNALDNIGKHRVKERAREWCVDWYGRRDKVRECKLF